MPQQRLQKSGEGSAGSADIPLLQEDGPILVIRSDPGPGKRCRNREWEWFASLSMIGIGATIWFTPLSLEDGAFRYLLALGLTSTWVWLFFLLVGLMRVGALFANGHTPIYGPHVRAIGCVVGALIWSNLTLALIRVTEDTRVFPIGIFVFALAVVFELRALHRALVDVGSR